MGGRRSAASLPLKKKIHQEQMPILPLTQFKNTALVLAGHGSTVNAESSAAVRRLAVELRGRALFAEVRAGFWKEEPHLKNAFEGLTARRIFVAPVFISEGYFSEEVLPRELGFRAPNAAGFSRRMERGGQVFHYCRPVGTHPGMADVLIDNARAVLARFPFPRAPRLEDTALFVAAHGTEKNGNSRQAAEAQADSIRARNIFAEVRAVFMEEEPRIADCQKIAGAKNIVVVPFFVSDGMHTREDIPILLGADRAGVAERLHAGQPTWRNPTEARGKRVWYAESLANAPLLAEVVLQRVAEAAAESSATH